MVYTPSHRATSTKEWKYTFPNHQASRWRIALRYPPEVAWNKEVVCKAELLTSAGWKPFKELTEGSREKRRVLVIDSSRDDPKSRGALSIRTTLTATICDQQLRKGKPTTPPAPLTPQEKTAYLAETATFDFKKTNVKLWMNQNDLWIRAGEKPLDFAHRVYKLLRIATTLPYNTDYGQGWACSKTLRAGYGECCRHAIVGTSVLRANKIPARTICGVWAVDKQSKGTHCWGEFYLEGVGWVPYDSTYDWDNHDTEAYFAAKKGEILAEAIDFDSVIDAGPFGKQTIFALNQFPSYWCIGEGDLGKPSVETTETVRILKRLR